MVAWSVYCVEFALSTLRLLFNLLKIKCKDHAGLRIFNPRVACKRSKKMGSIRETKLKNGGTRFQASIRLRGHRPISAVFDRRTDAKAWVQKVEADIRCGRYQLYSEAKRHTFEEAVERYFKEHPISIAKRGHLDWWKKELGPLYLQDVRPAVIALHAIDGGRLRISGEELIARLWIFANEQASERERENCRFGIIKALSDSIEHGTRVCPPGQTQRQVIAVLQGRLNVDNVDVVRTKTLNEHTAAFLIGQMTTTDRAQLFQAANQYLNDHPDVNRDPNCFSRRQPRLDLFNG